MIEMKKETAFKEQISKMTTEEKAGLLSGRDIWSTKPVKHLKLPAVFFSDGPNGIRKQIGEADHLGLNASLPATCFPGAATIANSWNVELVEKIGELLGEEAASFGINVLLGPGLNIKRNPLCGRNFEYFSEDPYLSGKLAAAYIRGVQKKGVAACPKHFAVNNRETLRMVSDSILDERTLREIYLTGFEIAVKEGKPKAIMTSYNRINGVYANENAHLLQDILRKEWGFSGAVITDWGGSNDHVAGVEAGSSLEMPGTGGDSDRQLVKAVKEGKLSEDILNERVTEVLQLIQETKLEETKVFSIEEHHAAAQKAAEESIVLLKNEDDILPLKSGTKVGIIGEFANLPRYQGAGSSSVYPTKLDTTLDQVKNCPLQVLGWAEGYRRNRKTDIKLLKEALELAARSEVVLLYLGLEESSESEAMDRGNLKLPGNQLELLEVLKEVNENVVIVLSAGGVVEMPWISQCKGLLYGGLGGQAQAGAMVKAIIGQINPGGKLAETYPLVYEDTPVHNYWNQDVYESEYREGLYVGYRYYETTSVPVRFPFGYGLSYTKFNYSSLKVKKEGVSFILKNTGSREGSEIAQLYVGRAEGDIFRPRIELKGFAKIFLKAGEAREVHIPFDDKTFRYFDTEKGCFQTEKGKWQIKVGASASDVRLCQEWVPELTHGESVGEMVPIRRGSLPSYYSGKITNVSDEEFETLLRHPLSRQSSEGKAELTMNDAVCRMCNAKSIPARLVYQIIKNKKERSERRGIPDLNILFIYNLPFRGIAKMMNGMISMEMAEAILIIVNGHFFKGIGLFIRGYFKNIRNRRKQSDT